MFNKRNLNKRHSLNAIEVICLIAAIYWVCSMLGGDFELISINSVWSNLTLSLRHFHVIAVGLLPVYVALMVFGTAIVSVYLGSAIQRWLKQILRSE